MRDLVYLRPAEHLHTTDLPYRLCSWALDSPENVGVWGDEQGMLCAWAVLQTPFWTLDCAWHPESPPEIHTHLLAWAEERARAARHTVYGRPMWFVNVFRHQAERIRDLEAAGFVCQANVGENAWSKVLMQRHPVFSSPTSPLPAGFQVRPLRGVSEVAAYVALHRAAFQSESMTAPWRQRVCQHSAYRPDLDLVLEAPDGRLAGFCICWFTPADPGKPPTGRIELMGVHPEFQRQGLGRALLAEGIRRLHQLGAEQIFVESDYPNSASFALYEAVGFRVYREVLVYRRDYP